jgi:TPR repeat protein
MASTFAAPVAAEPYEDAIAAYNRGDFATALRGLRGLAEQGDPAAQYKLGYMYQWGQGVAQDLAVAYMWYEISARQHTPNAAAARDDSALLMSPAQIAKAQGLARAWKPNKELSNVARPK